MRLRFLATYYRQWKSRRGSVDPLHFGLFSLHEPTRSVDLWGKASRREDGNRRDGKAASRYRASDAVQAEVSEMLGDDGPTSGAVIQPWDLIPIASARAVYRVRCKGKMQAIGNEGLLVHDNFASGCIFR